MNLDTKVSYYSRVTAASEQRQLTVREVVEKIKGPEHMHITWQLQLLTDDDLKKQYKEKNFEIVTWSGVFGDRRKLEKLVAHTGLFSVDFDGKDMEEGGLVKLREFIENDPYTFISFISPSGTGIKAVLKTNIPTDGSTHKNAFDQIEQYYLEQTGCKMDTACKDIPRPCYLPHDSFIHVNENSEIFQVKAEEINPRNELQRLPINYSFNDSDHDIVAVQHCIKELHERGIDITAEPRYTAWRDIGFSLASLGETGRQFFHDVSRLHAEYDYHKCDDQFTKCRKAYSTSGIKLGTFFKACLDVGINQPKRERSVQEAKSARHSEFRSSNIEEAVQTSEVVDQEDGSPELREKQRILEKLMQSRYDHNRDVLAPPPIISIGEHIISTPGNITTITGQSKSGKSGVVSAILAGAIASNRIGLDTLGLTIAPNHDGKALIHIDTEQSEWNFYKANKGVQRRARMPHVPHWYYSYLMRGWNIDDKKAALLIACEEAIRMHGGIHMILLDGGADFLKSVNNEEEANSMVEFMEALCVGYDCPMVNVLHQNPGNDKERGHFGSQLQRKSESVLSILRDSSGISTLEGKLLRNAGVIPKLSYEYSKEAGYHVTSDTSVDEIKGQRERAELIDILDSVLPEGVKITWTELRDRIAKHLGMHHNTGKDRIKKLGQFGLIDKDMTGLYFRTNL